MGAVPLIERCSGPTGFKQFRARPVADLNRDLSNRYGLPVDFSAKITGLAAIAQALSRGDIVHAQIATLHLQIPDPPPLAKTAQSTAEIVALAKELQASGLLKADWDPTKHPRWPAGSPDSIGGRFALADAGVDATSADGSNVSTRTAEAGAIPMPFDLIVPRGIPLPQEVVPPLGIYPRDLLRNPFPDRPECEEEWAQARAYCDDLEERGLLGVGDYRGMGRTFRECVMGQVSEDCGGNPTA